MPIRLILIDDHQLVRQGRKAFLKSAPGIELIGEASAGQKGIELVKQLRPDVLLLDITMPGANGIELLRQLCDVCHILILSMQAAAPYVVEAFQAGAMGYILKSCDGAELLTAVRTVAARQRYLSNSISKQAILAYARGWRAALEQRR